MQNQAFNDPTETWQKVCAELQKLISPDAYKRWFSPVKMISLEPEGLILGVDNSIYQYWIEENYLQQLHECLFQVTDRDVPIRFEHSNGVAPMVSEIGPQGHELQPEAQAKTNTELVSRYLFETYVVGVNNQFAHAAAVAVADAPAKIYNPLFIHGHVGLGKTHLMHAVGHRIASKKKNAKIVYVTSEQFTNEFVSAIQKGELVKFRKRFRQADALLIDDIQFFVGKERSQEEFFHTFNALFDGSKQIVMTSDCPPADISNLEQRLVSRFEWGLTAELQPPDIETRLAILKAKAQKMNVSLGDTVLMFIAQRVKANIRRLEGALNRVAAWAALNDKKISQEQVEELLKDFIQQESRNNISIDQIQRRVAEGFDIRVVDMTSKRRPNNIAFPRMIAMYLCRKLTIKSLSEIGEAFGGRDHGTVLHAYKTVEIKLSEDPGLRHQVQQLTQRLEIS
ncbi:MAG: chromosomal replication initiator protein DnaA [Blastochloris sp.]|nr:chromosomal replication initiator protein DnaA [Blastochloris sp.]